jgi:hypothetical protein
MLQAPDFLYRSEIGDASGKLTPDEIATELSYTFGGTTPSAALAMKAASGALGSPDALVQEALALQQTPKGHQALESFFREWTGYEKVLGATKVAAPIRRRTRVDGTGNAEVHRRGRVQRRRQRQIC